ncbi:MAG: ABC transporter ATP-binding protein [Lentisphaerae bacterium]|nr:ABC transporter ATP-binding protein [Lentisphaerota bacterium]HQQ60877.1 ABC transporter ATP-binding protein [Kiritimatiellia bacterium]
MTIVEAKGLVKDYREGRTDVHALRGVDLQIGEGEFIAVAGPSGSGKTTLLNIVSGLDSATAGEVRVDGEEISGMRCADLSRLRLHKIGFVFQSYNLIPVLTARENVEFTMLLQGVPAGERRRRAMELLGRVGLQGLENRRPPTLSGGQQQRVAVARAIVTRPRLVLADEPTANLDSETGAKLLDLMRELNRAENMTFVFSTHDPMVMDYSRRLIRLHDGLVASDERRPASA